MQKQNSDPIRIGQNQLIPFLWTRRSIGLFGFSLPLILICGSMLFGNCKIILSSISDYYHTNMRDVFAVVMGLLSFSFFTYRGHEKKDSIAANLAAVLALCIVFFSTSIKENAMDCVPCNAKTHEILHLIFASLFFLVLTYFALFLFTKTTKGVPPTKDKIKRNLIYRICGFAMLFCIAVIVIYILILKKQGIWVDRPIILIFEWIALWAFGISW